VERVREARNLIGLMEQVAFGLGIEIRYENLVPDGEPGSTRGGFCRFQERELILIDSRPGPVERCAALAEALRTCDLSETYIPPAVRRLIEGDGKDEDTP
jgi:hypothetical protein